ncbi:gliding motility-associated C-terminal domain-containing protein [Crocinitomicaceae bacterium]|nr:gliding motility-associated C-terminal domain-containing protein [Crocinitomicaceae bacterium]
MYLTKHLKTTLLTVVMFLTTMFSYGQLDFGNGYLIGDFVNVAVSGERGREGTDVSAFGFHQRAPADRCGFVADPNDSGWLDGAGGMDGDFFMPGTPENGWGLKIDGVEYSNAHNAYDIIADPDNPISWVLIGDCITVTWTGETVTGVRVILDYHLILGDAFYTTEVTIINNTGADLVDAYYYRNVDPDNNQPISGTYTTTNTIVSQPADDCQKALVSAESGVPHDSYLGFGGLGAKFRVSHGGFSNRDGEDIWNGTGGLEGTVGAVSVADAAISLAYKDDIPDTDTLNFTFAVVLSEDAVEGAFSSLYYIDYESAGGIGGGVINSCNPVVDTVTSCNGNPAILTVQGPNDEDYVWTWTSDPLDPDAETDGPTIEVAPDETTTYTVSGIPISDCLEGEITKTIVVQFSEGPDIEIVDPGPQCEEFDITTLEFSDVNDTEDPNIVFLSEFPDSAGQVEPEFTGPLMGPDDDVWLMIGDTANGCFDVIKLEFEFGGIGVAGDDTTIALCGESGVIVDLYDYITEGITEAGSFEEETFSGQFNEATGEFTVAGLGGTYEFTYTVSGLDPCPDDEATFIVEVYPQPVADFEYEVDGVSSADGLASTCIINEVDFVDFSTIPAPGTITSWDWDFGGDGTSTDENPSHTFSAIGTYIITLTVTTDDGCTSTFEKEIIIYEEPILDAIFNDPTCTGFSDGSITAFVEGGSGTFDIEITDEDGTVLNADGSNTANTLSAGTYYINVVDGSGCSALATVVLTDPLPLIPYYRVVEPLCYGDPGYIVIDSVQGEAINNAISYFWAPETDVPNGYEADSVNVTGGTYILTINDERGCSNVVEIEMTEPAELLFTSDLGYDPAYCRLYGYQNGNGQVYGGATGGTGTPSYLWEDLQNGDTEDNSTWGGRNPGDYRLTVTDDNGCMIDTVITVDSLNPIADFNVISDQLNADLKGTAPVEAVFENTSLYFANPNNPLADTTFFWNLDTANADYFIIEDYFFMPDTIYGPKGQTYEVVVCLTAQNKNGCSDTECKTLTIFEPITFVNVNIFTPNGDGNNDIFTFSQYAASISEFYCVIVNRWGVKVGEITDIDLGWDGTDMNGDPVSDGVYFYKYEATADNGEKLAGQGNVTVAK